MEEQIRKLLDELAEAQAHAEVLRQDYTAMYARILAPVQVEIEALDAEMLPKSADINATIDELTEAVKAAARVHGQSVSGAHLQAVWNKGRTSWDTKGLAGYMVAHPEIKTFMTVGAPTVSIRRK